MNNLMYLFSIIPIIIFLVEIAIKLGFPRKLAPIGSLMFGVIPAILFFEPYDLKKGILFAIIIALCTTGAVSSYKNIVEYVTKSRK